MPLQVCRCSYETGRCTLGVQVFAGSTPRYNPMMLPPPWLQSLVVQTGEDVGCTSHLCTLTLARRQGRVCETHGVCLSV